MSKRRGVLGKLGSFTCGRNFDRREVEPPQQLAEQCAHRTPIKIRERVHMEKLAFGVREKLDLHPLLAPCTSNLRQ